MKRLGMVFNQPFKQCHEDTGFGLTGAQSRDRASPVLHRLRIAEYFVRVEWSCRKILRWWRAPGRKLTRRPSQRCSVPETFASSESYASVLNRFAMQTRTEVITQKLNLSRLENQRSDVRCQIVRKSEESDPRNNTKHVNDHFAGAGGFQAVLMRTVFSDGASSTFESKPVM